MQGQGNCACMKFVASFKSNCLPELHGEGKFTYKLRIMKPKINIKRYTQNKYWLDLDKYQEDEKAKACKDRSQIQLV